MRRIIFYLLVALLAFGIGSLFAVKFYWVENISSIEDSVPVVQAVYSCPILPAKDDDESNYGLSDLPTFRNYQTK